MSQPDRVGMSALIRRLSRVGALIVGHSLVAAVETLGVPSGHRSQVVGRRLRNLIEQLGPTPMKAAQILATRRDVLPPWLCQALAGTWDRTEPVPADVVRGVLAGDGRFDPNVEPVVLGSGAIASVYQVRTGSGVDVAVKILRPGVAQSVQVDLRLLQIVTWVVQRLPWFRGIPMEEMVLHTSNGIRGQLNLGEEARTLTSLAESLSEVDLVRVPTVHAALCNETVLVMDVVKATPHNDESAPADAARHILHAIYRMLFTTGLVHVDLHPGNLVVTEEDVVLYDAGFVVQVPDRVRKRLADFFIGLALNDPVACADAIMASAVTVGPKFDRGAFTEDVRVVVKRFSRLPAREFSLVELATALFGVQKRHHLFAESEFVFPLLSLLTIEGQIRELEPEVDFQGIAIPYAMTAAGTLR